MTTVEMVVKAIKATLRATRYLKKSRFVPVFIALSLLFPWTLGTLAFWSRCFAEIGAIDAGRSIALR